MEVKSLVLIWTLPLNCCVTLNKPLDTSVATSSNVRRKGGWGFCPSSYLNLLRATESSTSVSFRGTFVGTGVDVY